MMTQSIPIQASAIVNGAVGSANFAKRSGLNEFEIFLAGSIKGETKITERANTIKENANKNNSQDRIQSKDGKEKIIGLTKDNKSVGSDKSMIFSQTVDNVAKDDMEAMDFNDSNLFVQIMTMLGQIKNVIMEELELTPEELDTMMADLGLELSDLTNPQAIMQLVMADKGSSDPFALLMDEQLGDSFKNLLASVNDIVREANLKLTDEEIKLIVQESSESDVSQAIIGADESETLQPLVGSKQAEDETAEGKDKVIRYQARSEDSQISDLRPVIVAKGESDLKDNNDHKAESDRTDGFEAFLDKLSTNYNNPSLEFTNDNVRLYDIREIAQQIIDQIRVIIKPEQTTMELQLNPEHLGKVNLTISSREGVMTAHFAVQNDLAKEAIEGQLITLKDTLAQQGIKVETIEVTVASYTFDQKSPSDDAEQMMHKKQKSGHKITFEEAVAMSEEPLEEAETILTGTTGYTINYTA
ncbi:MAG: flagellar hook-length control protein FliK [Anaerolineaceae bacterium]|nr:MAG: flagellar hook-length control protein FliK [Anaerolineaceae bacterium]